jgi:hypothetical protein
MGGAFTIAVSISASRSDSLIATAYDDGGVIAARERIGRRRTVRSEPDRARGKSEEPPAEREPKHLRRCARTSRLDESPETRDRRSPERIGDADVDAEGGQSEELLADLEQVGRERVAEGVAGDALVHAPRTRGIAHGALHERSRAGDGGLPCRPDRASAAMRATPVPARVARGVGQLARNGIRQPGLAPPGRQILFPVRPL